MNLRNAPFVMTSLAIVTLLITGCTAIEVVEALTGWSFSAWISSAVADLIFWILGY